jgi:hypothetical protein
VFAKNLQRSICTRVIIGDYRIYVPADVVQCVSENKCFISNAGDSDQEVPMTQQVSMYSSGVGRLVELQLSSEDLALRLALRSGRCE